VGIAESQTGVYPVASPGGWQIIGRTPLRLFAPEREDPFLYAPGDRIRFVPIGEAAFRELSEREGG
jgi:inhibitor of KinA